jgi:hypothetical protein
VMLNTLMIVVYSRKSFRKTTMGFYYVILGLLDNVALISLSTGGYLITIGNDSFTRSELSCRLTMYFVRLSQQIPGWIEVLLTYDRLAFVAYPNRFQFLRSRLNIALIIAGIILILCCINSVNLWLVVSEIKLGAFRPINSSASIGIGRHRCDDYEYVNKSITIKECTHFNHDFLFLRDLIAISSRIILPFLLMAYGNLKLAMKFIESKERLRRDRQKQQEEENEQQNVRKSSISIAVLRVMHVAKQKELAFVKPIILMNLLFILSLLPITITAFVMYAFRQTQSPEHHQYQSRIRLIHLFYNIFIYLTTVTLSLSCLFNLFFNKLFKEELYSMLNFK